MFSYANKKTSCTNVTSTLRVRVDNGQAFLEILQDGEWLAFFILTATDGIMVHNTPFGSFQARLVHGFVHWQLLPTAAHHSGCMGCPDAYHGVQEACKRCCWYGPRWNLANYNPSISEEQCGQPTGLRPVESFQIPEIPKEKKQEVEIRGSASRYLDF